MIQLLLRLSNAPILFVLATLGVAVQTAFFATPPLAWIQPDILLVGVIWCGLRRNMLEGCVLTLLFANIAEIHSSAPQGALMATYSVIYLLVRTAAKMLVLPDRTSLVFLTMASAIIWRLSLLLIIHLLGASSNLWRHTLIYLFPGAIIQGGLGYLTYRFLDRLDWVTFKNPRAQQILEDEIPLEGEGI